MPTNQPAPHPSRRPEGTSQRFLNPPSWVDRHVSPWLNALAFSGFMGYYWYASRPHGLVGNGLFAGASALFLLVMLMRARDRRVTCFTIGPHEVTLTERGKTQTVLFSEIRGFCESENKNTTTTYIQPLAAGKPLIGLDSKFTGYAEIRRLLAQHVPDLDAPERARQEQALADTTARLLQDPALGPTPEDREKTLARTGRLAICLNVAAMVLSFGTLFYTGPYDLVLVLNVGLASVAAAATWVYRDTVRLLTGSTDPRASIAPAIILPSVALIAQTLVHVRLSTWFPLLPVAGYVALALLLLLLLGNWPSFRDAASPVAVGAVALVAVLSYGLAATMVYNGAFGGQGATICRPLVLGKHHGATRGERYHLSVTPWQFGGLSDYLRVEPAYYDRVKVGDPVPVRLYHGRLGADWFEVVESE